MNAIHPGHHRRVDGNAAGGLLLEIFGREMTTARATCRHCAQEAALADAVAEVDDSCVILLCRGCDHTLLTYLRSESEQTLTVGGLTRLRWPRGADGVTVGPAGIEPTTSTVESRRLGTVTDIFTARSA